MIRRILIALSVLIGSPAGMLALPTTALAQSPPATIILAPPFPPDGELICVGGFIYQVRIVGSDAFGILGGSTCGSSSHSSSFELYLGNPDSLQGTELRSALSLNDSFDMLVDEDPELIGVNVNVFDAGGVEGTRLDGRVRKAFRVFEGSRARLLIDVPVNIINVDGDSAIQGVVAAALDTPINDRWTVTPRLSVGALFAEDFGFDGELFSASISSRYRFPQVGRGDLVIGNLLAYTETADFGLTESGVDADVSNVVLRNGVAYQFPLRGQFMGRQASLRASYIHTYIGGDEVALDNYHELSVNYGVRAREGDPRNRFELFRVGLAATFASDYQGLQVSAGFRY